MIQELKELVPQKYRRRGWRVIVTIFCRALLNFAGLATLLPVLLLILDPESLREGGALHRLYEWGGFSSEGSFVAAVCAATVLLIFLKSLLMLLLYRTERNYLFGLYRQLSRRLYIVYFQRGLGFSKQSHSAVLMRNVNAVTLLFVNNVLHPAASIICETALFGMLLTAMLLYDAAAVGSVLLVFLPVGLLYYGLLRRRLLRCGEAENRASREKARIVSETFRGYADIQVNRAFPQQLERFDAAMETLVDVKQRNATMAQLPSMFMETGLAAGMAVLILAGRWMAPDDIRVLFGIFAVGALRLMPSVKNIMAGWASIKYHRYTIDLLREALQGAPEEPATEESSERLPFRSEIRVEGVSFRFEDEPDKELFDGLSLTIRKGERVGIRGRSGAGKTTLFHLLLGLYSPTVGSICIDGEPLDETRRRRWQNNVGYVSQTVFLSDSTFAANVAFGEPADRIDRERVARVLKQARLDDFIATLPQGMNTPVGECGCRLSGGQRQRLGIARALYKEAEVLFFDEATSSLDSLTEEEINRAIRELSEQNRDLTIVVIAHREASLAGCDRIIDL